jgi:hypothetical protein
MAFILAALAMALCWVPIVIDAVVLLQKSRTSTDDNQLVAALVTRVELVRIAPRTGTNGTRSQPAIILSATLQAIA